MILISENNEINKNFYWYGRISNGIKHSTILKNAISTIEV